MIPKRGSVLLVDLDPTRGHEQRDLRPCVVISSEEVAADQGFPLIAIVPVTRTAGVGALYPSLDAGASGLASLSYALIDHHRSVDKRRIRRTYGQISPREMAAIDEGLRLYLGLSEASGSSPTETELEG